MFDRNQTTLSIRSRTMRLAGATIAGLAVVALSLFVASTASGDHRDRDRDRDRDRNRAHVSVCRDQAHHHTHSSQGRHGHGRHLDRRHGRQRDSDHNSHHASRRYTDRYARWGSGLHLGLVLPQLQIRFDQPRREQYRDRDRHKNRHNKRHNERKHRARRGHDRH
jgi:hypothetical protein